MSAQLKNFGELIGDSWSFFRDRFQPIAYGVVVFAIVIGVLQMPASADNAHQTVSATGGVLMLVSTLISLVSYVYYLLIATKQKIVIGDLFMEAVRRALPFFGLSLWLLIRTFTWVAVVGFALVTFGGAMLNYSLLFVGMVVALIGIVCLIVIGPRFACAPALWIIEHKGIFASANRSHDVTRGYWGKVFGNIVLLSLIYGVAAALVGAVLSPLVIVSPPVYDIIIGLLSQAYQAFLSIFLVQLTVTLVANPRKA